MISGKTAARWRCTSSAAAAKSPLWQVLTPSTSSSRNGSAPMRSGTSCDERPTTSTRPAAATRSSEARIACFEPVASTTTSGRSPPAQSRTRATSSLSLVGREGERGARGAPLEPRGDAVDQQHRRAAVERRDRDRLADRARRRARARARRRAMRPRTTVRTAIDIGSTNAARRGSSMSTGNAWCGGHVQPLLQRAVLVDADQADVLARVLAAHPAAGAVAARGHGPDGDALPGGEAGGQSGPTSSTIAENSCPWMRG